MNVPCDRTQDRLGDPVPAWGRKVPAPRIFGVAILVLGLLLAGALPNAGAQESGQNQSAPDALLQAYQREFVFLNNEIELLEQRIQDVTEDGEQRIAEARDELDALEAELLDLTREVDQRQEELRVVESEQTQSQDASDTLNSIITQATSRLGRFDVPPYSESQAGQSAEAAGASGDERRLDELSYVFFESIDLLNGLGELRREEGRFFLEDGTEVSGELTHIGRIASFGMSDEAGGTLAPAGGGRLRLVEEETQAVARELAAGGQPETLPIFLYESLDNLVETSGGQSIRDTIAGGGMIGIVILSIGGVAVLLIIVRILTLSRLARRDPSSMKEVVSSVQKGSLDDALTAAKKLPAASGRVIRATLKGLKADPSTVEDVVSESVLNEQPALDRFRSALSVFAAVAPLLGLLGTVTGMISTFDVITQYGTGDPKLLSGGISEALITTELGLAVAIPTLLIGNLLSSWSDRVTSNLEVSALRIVNIHGGFEGGEGLAS